MFEEETRAYLTVGSGRLLDVKVVFDNDEENPIYRGKIDEAPENIKSLKYSKINISSPITYYVYSKFN